MRNRLWKFLILLSAAYAALTIASAKASGSDTITIATVIGPANPYSALGFPSAFINPIAFDGLTELGEKGAIQPALAAAWKAESPLTWVFELRTDVWFSNGEHFNADAVQANFKFLKSPEGVTTSAGREISHVSEVAKRGEFQVAITTSRADRLLPQKLVSIKMLAPSYLETTHVLAVGQAGIGTGPYIETSRTPTTVTYARNTKAWRVPLVPKVRFVSLAEIATRTQAMISGDADIALDVLIDDVDRIKQAGGRTQTIMVGSVELVQFVSTKNSPIQDARVRRALNYAVNKSRLTQHLLDGNTAPATQFIGQEVYGYDPALPEPYKFDPERAKSLLVEAGYPNGFDLPIEILNSLNTAPYQQVAGDLRAVGVKVKLTRLPIQNYAKKYQTGNWDGLAFSNTYNAAPSMDGLRPLRMNSCLRPNPWHCDQSIASQITLAEQIYDGRELLPRIRNITKELIDNPPGILLYENFKLVGLGPRVQTFIAPLGYVRYDMLDFADPTP